MENPKHIALVHGACHGAWCWYMVATLLKSSGLKVTCLDMAASGINPKQITEIRSFSDHFAPLIEFIGSLPPDEKVVVVGHSMGGFCIVAAMERFPKKIAAGVFATAFMPGPELTYSVIQDKFNAQEIQNVVGQYRFENGPNNPPTLLWLQTEFLASLLYQLSPLEFNAQEIPNVVGQYRFENGPNNPPTSLWFQTEFLASLLYQLSPLEDLELATLLKRPMALHDVAEAEKALEVTKEKYASVPRVFVMCGQDKIITPNLQRWMVENNPEVDVKPIDGADHMVMFSKPDELSSILVDVANKY